MKTLFAMTILSGVLVSPAFAQMSAEDMSCADFTAMDPSAQMAAVSSMESRMEAGSSSGAMSPDRMESDAMRSEDSMKSEDGMKAHGMASGDKPVTAKSVAAACADHPDMTVHEAMDQGMMAH
jgi:hypothetical protein